LASPSASPAPQVTNALIQRSTLTDVLTALTRWRDGTLVDFALLERPATATSQLLTALMAPTR
jgi:hypothetical protein